MKAEETRFQQTKPQDDFQAEWKWYKTNFDLQKVENGKQKWKITV